MFRLTIVLFATSLFAGSLFSTPSTGDDQQETQQQQRARIPGWNEKKIENYLGHDSCRKCHKLQVEKLETTAHFTSFERTHRLPKAKAYCQQLGIRSIKRDQRCVRCHYTPEESRRGVVAQSGVSCESCHGPAKHWAKVHNDYGGLLTTKAREKPAHRVARISESIKKGMRHPSNLYLLAKSCYECHLVDDAQLVNVTDHPPVTAEFNMVSWSQGSMRHNFLRTDNKSNGVSSPARLRVMFVADLLAKLEACMQALARSERGSEHFNAMTLQYVSASKQIDAISSAIDNTYVNEASRLLQAVQPVAEPKILRAAADGMGKIGFEFGKHEKSHQLEAIQSMLPDPSQYR